MDEVWNTVVQEGIIEKLTFSKDLRPLRASYMVKGREREEDCAKQRDQQRAGDTPISSVTFA